MRSPRTDIELASEPMLAQYQRLGDIARTAAFQEALTKLLEPNCKVLDLCTDAGQLAFMAAKRASKVFCLASDKDEAAAIQRLIGFNSTSNKIEIVSGDVTEYVPRESVDVVFCDFIRMGLLNSPQTLLVQSIRDRFSKKFGEDHVPQIFPAATVLAIQPLQFNFNFSGYLAPVPIIQAEDQTPLAGTALADPVVYAGIDYNDALPLSIEWDGEIFMQHAGTINAFRIITKNVVAALDKEDRVLEWFMPHLVVPVTQPVVVSPGNAVRVHIGYHPGDSVDALQATLTVSRV